ncbi:hypothetical protein AYO40_01200 [Planctomycetaceae bacterium SCGC AG-212-D15]|nr:hypothetical protein AYO40_01200 [Planctomycetaceae bacterium SCGC AG-212-D15]
MSTPISSATSYASIAQLQQFKDTRLLGDLLLDTGNRESSAAQATDAILQLALNWASGEIESACLVGNKYQPADLNALTGMSQANLVGLCCDLAFWKLLGRRYPTMAITEEYRSAMEKLDRLRLGERIFGLQAQMNAGDPADQFMTLSNIDNVNLNTTIACRFYGTRGKVIQATSGGSSGCGCC